MRKLLLLVMAFVLLIPAAGVCAKKKDDKKKDEESKEEKKPESSIYYKVYFATGGVYEADNFTIEKEHIMLILESGPIFLDKSMVTSIEKYEVGNDEPTQRINVTPTTTGQGGAPAAAPKPSGGEASPSLGEPDIKIVKPTAKKEETYRRTTPRESMKEKAAEEEEAMDDDGHNEQWWKIKMNKWVRQREQGIKSYDEAKEEWNKYDGALANLNTAGGASDYDVQRYQDLRGAARIKMDRAKGEIEEAEDNLLNVIPDEARRAGAPRWWVDWNEEKWTE